MITIYLLHVYGALGRVYMSKLNTLYLSKFGQSYFIRIQNLSNKGRFICSMCTGPNAPYTWIGKISNTCERGLKALFILN